MTFRLDGSLPEAVLEQWRIEKKRLEMTLLRWAAISPPGTIPDPEAVAEEKLKFHNPIKAGLVAEWQDWKWSYRRLPEQE